MNTATIVWFAFTHVFALLGLVLSCGYVLRWLDRKRKKAMLEILFASSHVLEPSVFDGDVNVMMVNGVVTIWAEASDVRGPDGERDLMEICVTEWNARRILTELSKTLKLPLTRLAKKKIREGVASSGSIIVGYETGKSATGQT